MDLARTIDCLAITPAHRRVLAIRVLALSILAIAASAGFPLATGGCVGSSTRGANENGSEDDEDDDGDGGTNGITPKATFAVIGDYGDEDDDTRAVADLIKSWEPDFIITTGDNDYSDGAFRGTFEGLELAVGQYFHEFIGNYQGDSGPGADRNRFFPTPGDHDWGDTCDDPEGLDDYLRYFTLPGENSGNERYYDFREGAVHFFSVHSLDGCEPDGVSADSPQARWVEEEVMASDAPFKIAYFHNPPYSSGDRHIGEGAHMRWPWAEWGFDLVLSGDDHVYERIERDGTVYVVNGLGGVDRHDFVSDPVSGSVVRFADQHGAMRVRVFDDRLDAEFISVDGAVVDRFTIRAKGLPPDDGLDPDVPPVTEGEWFRPGVETLWQWQLQPDAEGRINTGYAVEVYDIDLFEAPSAVIDELHDAGRSVICYFSAGSFEDFREDAGEFQPEELGRRLEGFEDERWLDIRAANVHRIMQARLDLAVARGCDGVEPDNVDGFANDTGFPLTATDQLAFNRFLANEAHRRGLAVALKNDLDQVAELVDYFDFSVNEQCHEFDECEQLLPFIQAGKPVFNAEYEARWVNNAAERQALCEAALELNIRTLVLPIDLDDSFRFSCDP